MNDTNRDNIIDLMNEITRLQNNNEKLLLDNLELRNEAVRERSAWENVVADKHFEIERLQKERDEARAIATRSTFRSERLRANSERYEWLKSRIHLSLNTHITEFRQPDGSLLRRPYRLIANEILFDPRETLDATIDTAIALEANNFMDLSHD